MARQVSIIKIKGKIGDLSFYKSAGKHLVREKTGIEKERLLHDPAFKRTRENMSEFGGSAVVGKALRMGLANVLHLFSDRYIVARITKIMRSVNKKGTGTRGKRAFEIKDNSFELEGFDFDKKTSFDRIFHAPFTLEVNADRNGVTLTVPVFNTDNYLEIPEGATHFRLFCAISVLSNYVFDDESLKYEPLNPEINMASCVEASSETELGGDIPSEIVVNCDLPDTPTLDDTSGLIACVGIEFLQEINGAFYSLESDNAMKIARVF